MGKVYVLNGSKGQYDDHHNFVVGVYSSMELAEDAKIKVIENIKRMTNIYTKRDINIFESKLQKEFNSKSYKKSQKLSKEMNNYFSWRHQYSPQEYNIDSYRIDEYEIDEVIIGIIS